jgi:hypothetical protein
MLIRTVRCSHFTEGPPSMPSACLDSLYTDLHRRTAGIVPGHWRKVEAELAPCDGLDALVALIRNGKRSDAVLGPLLRLAARDRDQDAVAAVAYALTPLVVKLSREFRDHAFMTCLFAMFATVDGDALIRCQVTSEWGDRRNLGWWGPEMAARFAVDETTTPEQASEAYRRLSAAFRNDLYVTTLTRPRAQARPRPGHAGSMRDTGQHRPATLT